MNEEMLRKAAEFRAAVKIGSMFICNSRMWQVTDIGTRTVMAIPQKEGWMEGPPYSLAEIVFDEEDAQVCEPIP